MNNPKPGDLAVIFWSLNRRGRVCFQLEEAPTTGTPHVQGTVSFAAKCRPLSVLSLPIRWEKRKGTEQEARDYCTKEESRIGDPWISSAWRTRPLWHLERSRFYPWQESLMDTLSTPPLPTDRKIRWIWEPLGNSGKSAFCKYMVIKHNALVLAGKASDVLHGIAKFREEKGIYPEIVLYDIPRSFNTEFLSYQALESVKNGLFFSGKYEGAMHCFNSPHLVVFGNVPPDLEKLSKDRWIVQQIITTPLPAPMHLY